VSKKEFVNGLMFPLELLWAGGIPLTIKIRILVAEAHPVPLDVQSLVNICQASRTQVRESLKSLSRKGLISRKEGKVSLVVESLPPVNPKGLASLRAVFGRRLRRKEIPVPLGERLAAQREASRDRLSWRFPPGVYRWLSERDALSDTRWWGFTLKKRIQGSESLMGSARGLSLRAEEVAGDLAGMTPEEILVDYLMIVLLMIEKQRGKPIRNPCGLLTSLLKKLEAGGEREDDLILTSFPTWLSAIAEHPPAERKTLGEFLGEEEEPESAAAPPPTEARKPLLRVLPASPEEGGVDPAEEMVDYLLDAIS